MKVCFRIAAVRRQVKRFAAIAAECAMEAESIHTAASFRPLSEAETEAIVGGDLLATIAAGAGVLKS